MSNSDKKVVIYRSKSGYTQMYAEWIAQALQCELLENEKLTLEDLLGYDTIIYGGGFYACRINGLKLITDNFEQLKEKSIVIWATGSSPGREEELKHLWDSNFTQGQLNKIKTFYLRGGFDYQKLSKTNKFLMSMLKMKLKLTKERNEDQQGLLEAYDVPEYHCSKENIKELINYINSDL